jgi:hypothetical protein
VDAQTRIAPNQRACGARVVEMDVREDEVAEILDSHFPARERGLERAQARGRPAVDERRLVVRPQVGGDDLRSPEVEEIERLEVPT